MPKADNKTIAQRLSERYVIDPISGCWVWIAGKNGKGYPYIWVGPNRKSDTRQAYKVSWELKYGPVPSGFELHHKCQNTACINPEHLELVTRREHKLKHSGFIADNAKKTTCPNGHAYTHTNNQGSRCCRICINAQARARRNGKVG